MIDWIVFYFQSYNGGGKYMYMQRWKHVGNKIGFNINIVYCNVVCGCSCPNNMIIP